MIVLEAQCQGQRSLELGVFGQGIPRQFALLVFLGTL